MSIDTGGQAFPVPSDQLTHGTQPGMTLIDHFAGLAMQALVTEYSEAAAEALAKHAYYFAEAMVAEKRRIEGGAP